MIRMWLIKKREGCGRVEERDEGRREEEIDG